MGGAAGYETFGSREEAIGSAAALVLLACASDVNGKDYFVSTRYGRYFIGTIFPEYMSISLVKSRCRVRDQRSAPINSRTPLQKNGKVEARYSGIF